MATVPFVNGRTSYSWRKTPPYFGTRKEKFVVEKGAIFSRKSIIAYWPSCVARNPSGSLTVVVIF